MIKNTLIRSFTTIRYQNQPIPLHYQFLQSSNVKVKDNLIVLHGLFGSHTNFRSIVKNDKINSIVNSYCLDLRNHGLSQHKNTMSLTEMGEDLVYFLDKHNIYNAFLMGHSMGGRVILSALRDHGKFLEERVKGIIICDITNGNLLKERSADVYQMWIMINQLLDIDFKNKPKIKIQQEVKNLIENTQVANFMNMNVVEDQNGNFKWRMNLSAIKDFYMQNLGEDIKTENGWKKNVFIICGAKSHYINQEKIKEFYNIFPYLNEDKDVHFIKGAGHWLHADKQVEFIEKVSDFLRKVQEN
ncbi:hypothetical protein IMG5_134770 [Ichthyophthirius multifiliis]|uniref:AB hydrolase-1 domain-containing protein n=1 Tax=Ichthyophthirius multifiliis TaxID=5932 RepID=G0QWS3_ICHMU|nr:hypothetical protein IMG5_134770 [Ichthyophthirius multifiliis]EGR30328.1 hypothetical protein IMG5_134770 [Ichthyophthirius multifiliis]|eukprot:XP_004031915.1 hypothetical protein IMG5_134770 [Ichthyophthirius multifiliis]